MHASSGADDDTSASSDGRWMRRALELAQRGEGAVEPNPMVGCVLVRDGRLVGEGWHARYGAAHAEVEALESAGEAARGATAYVTLEPCSHQGKTPPCTEALRAAAPARVVVATLDPNPQVSGGGVERLREAGLVVEVGLLQTEADALIAPFAKWARTTRPWVIGKWAASLDGRIAAHTGDSQWITCEASRREAHRLRGRVDAVLVGIGTVRADDPLLTARPPGPRVATRVVLDARCETSPTSQLAKSAGEIPVLIGCGRDAPEARVANLRKLSCEVVPLDGDDRRSRLGSLLDELGRREMTNVLVEGGAGVLGALFDAGWLDEVFAFIAPKLIGGEAAPTPLAGVGVDQIDLAWRLQSPLVRRFDEDVCISGRLAPRA